MFQLAIMCILVSTAWYLQRSKPRIPKSLSFESTSELADNNCGESNLLRKHSQFKSFTTSRYTYPQVRVFWRKHPQSERLPREPAPLPLLGFVHGLGGSATQFHPLLTSLANVSDVLCVDLPGCGLSSFEPKNWGAYTTENLAELLACIFNEYMQERQGLVVIGHSMGCSLAALLASKTSPIPTFSSRVVGVVAICPKAEPPSAAQVALFKKLLCIPSPIFDLWRKWDRKGGVNSHSVRRFLGEEEAVETRKVQVYFNSQSRTNVWRRMAYGSLPTCRDEVAHGGLPGKDIWTGIQVPIFLVGGEMDHITKPIEVEKIASWLKKSRTSPKGPKEEEDSASIPQSTYFPCQDNAIPASQLTPSSEKKAPEVNCRTNDASSSNMQDLVISRSCTSTSSTIVKTTILPSPASHALLYQPSQVRVLSALISDFLSTLVSPHLSLAWQLQFLSTSGKWDVKNLEKWKRVQPVSEPIAGIFRAMKTLRQADDLHSPDMFVRDWGREIKDIVDISHESPVYDPASLERRGVRYHKVPTVSKIPPTSQEVKQFISLIDRLRDEQQVRRYREESEGEWYIGVHCHYGFNRTGYFICCYLIERYGMGVEEAIRLFGEKRPGGIRHVHFVDRLAVRYCKGLDRNNL